MGDRKFSDQSQGKQNSVQKSEVEARKSEEEVQKQLPKLFFNLPKVVLAFPKVAFDLPKLVLAVRERIARVRRGFSKPRRKMKANQPDDLLPNLGASTRSHIAKGRNVAQRRRRRKLHRMPLIFASSATIPRPNNTMYSGGASMSRAHTIATTRKPMSTEYRTRFIVRVRWRASSVIRSRANAAEPRFTFSDAILAV